MFIVSDDNVVLRSKRRGLNERAVLDADHAVNANEGSLRAIIIASALTAPRVILPRVVSDVLRANIWERSRAAEAQQYLSRGTSSSNNCRTIIKDIEHM